MRSQGQPISETPFKGEGRDIRVFLRVDGINNFFTSFSVACLELV